MASWKKVVVSGSDANLKSLVVSQSINAESFTGSLYGSAESAKIVVVNSDTAPTSSLSGSLWFNTENLTLYVNYIDPSGSAYWLPTYNAGIPVTASYSETSSLASLSQTASYVTTAQTASYVNTARTSSYVSTLNQNVTVTGSLTVSGTLSMSNRPAFRVTGNGGGTSAVTRLSGSMTTVDFNQGNHWDNTTGTFTAPIAGLYQINLVCRTASNTSTSCQIIVYKNNTGGVTGTPQVMLEWADNTSVNHIGGSTISKLEAGDTLRAVVAVGTISFDGNDNFSVAYLG
jgi:hypothetical protein